jgi:hypothetical protein
MPVAGEQRHKVWNIAVEIPEGYKSRMLGITMNLGQCVLYAPNFGCFANSSGQRGEELIWHT